jgi:hypothetical protein
LVSLHWQISLYSFSPFYKEANGFRPHKKNLKVFSKKDKKRKIPSLKFLIKKI